MESEPNNGNEGRADVLLHPIRMRLVRRVAADGPTTARQLQAGLPEVPPATLYRHLKKLLDAGWLEVADERQVRGALEKTYALPSGGAVVGAGDLAGLGRDDHARYFMTFLATLLGDFERYLARDNIDLVADRVGYRTVPIHATDAELERAFEAMRSALRPLAGQRPGPGRRCFDFSTVCIPSRDPKKA